MGWHLASLVVHFALLVMAVMLFRCAPCWMQKLVVVGMALGLLVMCLAFVAGALGHAWWLYVYLLGLSIEHVAVSIYIFRVVWQGMVKEGLVGHGHQHAAAAR